MKMNTALGYVPVSFNQLTDDDAFWHGCQGCINHNILEAKNRKFCVCTGMLCPEISEVIVATNQDAEGNATALYLSRMLTPSGIKVTRLASGLPMGSDIEFTDDLTLASALKGRVDITT